MIAARMDGEMHGEQQKRVPDGIKLHVSYAAIPAQKTRIICGIQKFTTCRTIGRFAECGSATTAE